MWGLRALPVDVLKLMCLFEIFGLPDCSAELILKYGESLGDERTRTEYLDMLAAEQAGAHDVRGSAPRFAADARRRFSPSSAG